MIAAAISTDIFSDTLKSPQKSIPKAFLPENQCAILLRCMAGVAEKFPPLYAHCFCIFRVRFLRFLRFSMRWITAKTAITAPIYFLYAEKQIRITDSFSFDYADLKNGSYYPTDFSRTYSSFLFSYSRDITCISAPHEDSKAVTRMSMDVSSHNLPYQSPCL